MSPEHTKETIVMTALPREEIGKGNRRVRKAGNIPANIFGEKKDSVAIALSYKDFVRVYKQAGESQVVYVQLSEKKEPTIIGEIQKDPLTNMVTHVNFKRVNLNKKVEAEIPVSIEGESEAIEKKHCELNLLHDHLRVEALPNDLPHEIVVDISTLIEPDDEIVLQDIPVLGKYEFIDLPETVIVKATPHVEHSVEPEIESEGGPEITGETAPAEEAASEEATNE